MSPDQKNNSPILYLHGRPMAHPMHKLLAECLGSDFYPIDRLMRWQDKKRSILYRIISWIANAFAYPTHSYDYLLVDNLHFCPVIARKLGLLRNKKMIVHLGSHTLYFMYTKRFSPLINQLHKYALRNYDVLFCEGEMAAELVEKVLGRRSTPPTFVTYLGVPAMRYNTLLSLTPQLDGRSILIIANGPTEFRQWYKGLDLMIKAYALACESVTGLSLTILGEWDEKIISRNLSGLSSEISRSISFVGKVSNIDQYLAKCALCLHCSRGDAFPTSNLEVMSAGVIPLVSVWTGTKEIIKKVDSRLVVPLEEQLIARRIDWYFSLPTDRKKVLSSRCRSLVQHFTEDHAVRHYRQTFQQIQRQV